MFSVFRKFRPFIPVFVTLVLFLQPLILEISAFEFGVNKNMALAQEVDSEPGVVAPPVTTPPAPAVAPAPGDSATPNETIQIQNRNISIDNCDLFNPASWIPCFMTSIYNLSAQALAVVGEAFNIALAFTLDTGCSGEGANKRCTVLASTQLENAWSNIKDLANIAFILGLIYISMSLITGWQSNQAKGTFIKIVLIAIVINFSLFGTKILIDAGNITAKMFYSQLVVNDQGAARTYDRGADGGGISGIFFSDDAEIKDISGAVMSKFNPTRLFNETSFDSFIDSFNGKDQRWGIVMVLMFAFTVMNVVIGVSFIVASLTFISRTVWLVLLSIVSPLALVSTFLPIGRGLFDKWLSMLFDRCFCVVVYLFFIWLLVIISDTFVVSSATPGSISVDTWSQVLLMVVVQFIAVYTIIKIATDQTKKMCEGGTGLGTFAAGTLNKLPGLVAGGMLGGAVGAVGLAARSTVGGAAYNLSQGRGVFGGQSNFIGKGLENAAANGSVSAVWARSLLKDIGGAKFGTNTGYSDKQDARVKGWQTTVNEMEGLRREKKKDELRDAFVKNAVDPKTGKSQFDTAHRQIEEAFIQNAMKNEKITREAAKAKFDADKKAQLAKGYEGTRQAERDLKTANATAQTETTNMLEKQASGVGGVMDFVIGRGVSAAKETARRRKEQIETDTDTEIAKRAKARETTDTRANLELAKSEVDKEGARSISKIQELIADGKSNEELAAALNPITEALLDPKKGFIREVSQDIRDQLEAIKADTLKDIAEIREEDVSYRDRIKNKYETGRQAIQDRLANSMKENEEAVDRIQRVRTQLESNSEIGEEDVKYFQEVGIDLKNDTFDEKVFKEKVTKRLADRRNQDEADIAKLQKAYDEQLKGADKDLKTNIKDAVQNRNRALKGRFDAMIAEGQANLLTSQERIEAQAGTMETLAVNTEGQINSRIGDLDR